MTRILAASLIALPLALGACGAGTTAALTADAETPAGQLFCAIESASGPLVVAAIDGSASAVPGAGPVAIIATGAAKSYVDGVCAAAGGVAVSPPSNPAAAPKVAVVPPVVSSASAG